MMMVVPLDVGFIRDKSGYGFHPGCVCVCGVCSQSVRSVCGVAWCHARDSQSQGNGWVTYNAGGWLSFDQSKALGLTGLSRPWITITIAIARTAYACLMTSDGFPVATVIFVPGLWGAIPAEPDESPAFGPPPPPPPPTLWQGTEERVGQVTDHCRDHRGHRLAGEKHEQQQRSPVVSRERFPEPHIPPLGCHVREHRLCDPADAEHDARCTRPMCRTLEAIHPRFPGLLSIYLLLPAPCRRGVYVVHASAAAGTTRGGLDA